jgi:5-carboxymethyl-2-hydroxymuconate isomerase
MPHIRLDTTADIQENAELPEILQDLVAELARHETIQPASIKAYHTLRPVWITGQGAPEGFIHCEIAILTGRPLDVRSEIAKGIESVLRHHFAASLASGDAGLTVEVREMDRETYIK